MRRRSYCVPLRSRCVQIILLGIMGSLGLAQGALALGPPATRITTQSGTPFRLYDNVIMTKPVFGGLLDRGFNRVLTWDGRNSVLLPPSPENPQDPRDTQGAPTKLWEDGSVQESDIRRSVHEMCGRDINPVAPTLFVLDIEWDWFVGQGSPRTFAVNSRNVTNIATVLRWIKSEFSRTDCKNVRVGLYGMIPENWNLFYRGPENADAVSVASWRFMVPQLVAQLNGNLDFLAPSLYAPWSPSDDAGLAVNHVTAWENGSAELLSEARSLASAYGLALIPFIGLRYYHEEQASTYYFKYIDATFFQAVLNQVTRTSYGCEGAVYWDWGPFGGPGYADDGSDVWSTSHPWYTVTSSFFKAPPRTFSGAVLGGISMYIAH